MSFLDLPKDVFLHMKLNPLDRARLRATCKGLYTKVLPIEIKYILWADRYIYSYKKYKHITRKPRLKAASRFDYIMCLAASDNYIEIVEWCISQSATFLEFCMRLCMQSW